MWHHPSESLALVMGQIHSIDDLSEQWEWLRNPLPPASEQRDFEVLRRKLGVTDEQAVAPGDSFGTLRAPDRERMAKVFPGFIQSHNPFIQRIIRRTREQLENQIDPETNEPLLQRIRVELLGEEDRDAILLPAYLRDAYTHAQKFCEMLGKRMKGSGFLKTLLLRRVGSSIFAGMKTAQRILDKWELAQDPFDEDDDSETMQEDSSNDQEIISRTLIPDERALLEKFVAALNANREIDPKYSVVKECLITRNWLERGCIVFSQYRDSIQWLADQLTQELTDEPIAIYSGPQTSGIMQSGHWTPRSREDLKKMVYTGNIRLMLGTDAASEGLNLQRLSTLINLDLPWNPTRLEQRKGRIQRIGQIHDHVLLYNLRYKDSVEDRVHQLLSERMYDIYQLFGQIPDVLEDVWVNVAMGDRERAQRIIDELPISHPFEIRYSKVEKVNWEACSQVLDLKERTRVLKTGW